MLPFLKKEDKPTVINFLFDGEQVSYEDIKILHKLQNGNTDPELLQILMAHFMVDEKGNYLPEEKAIRIIDKLKGKEIADLQAKFLAAFQEASIPKANGRPSNSPSTAGTPASPYPDGSQS